MICDGECETQAVGSPLDGIFRLLVYVKSEGVRTVHGSDTPRHLRKSH